MCQSTASVTRCQLERFPTDHVDAFLIERMAVRRSQLDVMLARFQMERFQVTHGAGECSINIHGSALQLRFEFYASSARNRFPVAVISVGAIVAGAVPSIPCRSIEGWAVKWSAVISSKAAANNHASTLG